MNGLNNPLAVLEDVLNVSQVIAREHNLNHQLNAIAQAASKMAAAQACCIYLLDKTQRFLVPTIKQGKLLESNNIKLDKIALSSAAGSRLSEISAYSAMTGQLVNIADIYSYSGFDFHAFYQNDKLSGLHTQSILCVPLTDREGLSTGVMMMFNHLNPSNQKVSPFPNDLENLVKGFAAIAAISIANSQLINENHSLLKQQEALNESLIIENKELKGRIYKSLQLDQIIGRSQAMEAVFSLIEKVASSTATVFLNGETGTGKELFAATIHHNSPVRDGKFVAQNCAAFPPDLLESEMFGYKKGAFSGATESKRGLFEEAHKGTLFLDEIGEMPMELQSKILRVLQEGELRPLGSTESIKVQVRIIAATNRDLAEMVREGTFREDLYYRLNVFPILLPALRERSADIPALVQYFVNKYNKQYGKTIQRVEPNVMDFLQTYAFPGNVRELQNIVERAVILAGEQSSLSFECLPQELKHGSAPESTQVQQNHTGVKLKEAVATFESNLLKQCLQDNKGNQTATAQQLGLSRRALVDKLAKYNLRRVDTDAY
ncbi:sigma 54-interacting transcriptional regulator [Ningiella sp. W23]|uniref:sigma-54 interaction domain-containing protein n=1 Tax=Ningiella sp. W23 TaxID=3023715 RepID=UPI00375687BB